LITTHRSFCFPGFLFNINRRDIISFVREDRHVLFN
jgi:hypothetical protein